MMPTKVKTRPKATLFCKGDELLVFELTLGVALGGNCTIPVEVYTGTDEPEGVLVKIVQDVGSATGADEGVKSALLDGDLVLGHVKPCILRH